MFAKIVAQIHKLRGFFLLGGDGPRNQHRRDGQGAQIDLCDVNLVAVFVNLVHKVCNVIWRPLRCTGAALEKTVRPTNS